MAAPGWIKLYRKITDNDLWHDKPFARGQAWIDLIMLANYEPKETWMDGKCIKIPRGSFITSTRKLAERWGWSRTKVKRFLNELETAQMVSVKCDSKKTTIKVLNYQEYQGADEDSADSEKATKRAIEKPQKNRRKDTEKPQKDTTKEVKKGNNKLRRKEAASPVSSDEDPAAAPAEDEESDVMNFDGMSDEEFERWLKKRHESGDI